MSQATRVVFVRSKSPAGIEPSVAEEATTLALAGHEVHAVLWDRERAFPAEDTRDGVHVHKISPPAPEGQPDLIKLLPRSWWYAFRHMASLRPHVVDPVDFDTILRDTEAHVRPWKRGGLRRGAALPGGR